MLDRDLEVLEDTTRRSALMSGDTHPAIVHSQRQRLPVQVRVINHLQGRQEHTLVTENFMQPPNTENGLCLSRPHLLATHRWSPCDPFLFLQHSSSILYKDILYVNGHPHSPSALYSFFRIRPATQQFSIYFYSPTLYSPFSRLSYLTMVSTRTKNKSAHPAAPVMTNAAKQKAGIKTKPTQKRVTKDQTIRELQARLAALENPDGEPFSKEPLVRTSLPHILCTVANKTQFTKGDSPSLDVDGTRSNERDATEDDSEDDHFTFTPKRRMGTDLPNPRYAFQR